MILTSSLINDNDLREIVGMVSSAYYGDNLTLKTCEKKSDRRTSWTLKVRSSSLQGAHHSAPLIGNETGRRTVSACWHCHRDVMCEIYDRDPNARIASGMIKYANVQDFVDNFGSTYYRNAGSMARPVRYGTLCLCEDNPAVRPNYHHLLTPLLIGGTH